MTPTAKLRFVERMVPTPEYGENTGKRVRILQQWWEDRSTDMYYPDGNGKWLDIPLETEDFTKK
jgi:hypothetical protein